MQIFWTSWVSLFALAMYFWTVVEVGKARGRHKIPAPSVDGPEEFLRALRVQSNTVEQMVFFFPALFLCAFWLSDPWAALGGGIWVAGRIWYALAYLKEAKKRAPGFMISTLASVALFLGALLGLSGILH
jgi:glutathione S-transferase